MLTLRPLISKEDILRAYNPNKPDSDSVFRRLRREGVVSAGITIKPRHRGRQRGTITAFYALNEDAAVAFRHGDVKLAKTLAALATKAETSALAKEVIAEASSEPDRGIDAIASLDGIYTCMQVKHHGGAMDKLAERITKDRGQYDERLAKLGHKVFLAWVTSVHQHAAELRNDDGDMFSMSRTPELMRLAEASSPVSLRNDLVNGVIMTFVNAAYALPTDDDPFADLRPPLPDGLGDRLDNAELQPLAVTGPRLSWA